MKIGTILLLLPLLYLAIACQKKVEKANFNFGFETKDSTGIFPDKWEIAGVRDTNYIFSLDSTTQFEGKYSLCAESKNMATPTTYGMIAWHSFLNGKGKNITVKARIKFEDATDGKAGFFVFTNDIYNKMETKGSGELTGTKDWQEYTVESAYPEDAKDLYIGLVLNGKGKVWFDDIRLLIDGKDASTMDTAEFTKPVEQAATVIPDTLISWQHPLPVSKKAERHAVYQACQASLQAPADSVKANPSAVAFPGTVSASAPRINRKIQIRHTPIPKHLQHIVANLYYSGKDSRTMYSTGLYAAPGEIITVEIPEELKEKINVQIGCHSDDLNQWMAAEEDWRRMPLIVRNDPLNETTTRTANPFGGLVYITCPPNAEAFSGEVSITNAVAAPYFILGKTTDEEWKKMVEETGAPWGELESNDIILTVSTLNLKKITEPAKQAQTWDVIVNACYDLAQIPTPFFRKQRIVADVHIGGGAMHSGYPIMATHCPSANMDSEFSIADPGKLLRPSKGGANWGFFHEIGHNMQNVKDWVFNGTTEVSVNFFSLYIFDNVLGGRNDAHEGVSIESTRSMMKDYFANGAKFSDWAESPFLGLITFRQIQNDFGWEPFKTVFRRFHEENAKGNNKQYSNQEKIDNFVIYFSDATKRNVMPFFKTWGIPVSESVTKSVSAYPEWMPYNFPPKIAD